MMSLFSPFDIYSFNFFFLSASFFFLSTLFKVWTLSSINSLMKLPISFMYPFFFSIKPKFMSKLSTGVLYSFFLFFFLMNFSSIFPFVFSHTSQCSLVLMFSTASWAGLIIFSLLNNSKGFLSHCVPEGAPSYLVMVLFGIEVISNLIRPFTLMIRLVANILAGHLLMSLLGNLVIHFAIAFPAFIVLNMVEIFVSLIQSYIFSTMVILYFSEIF